MPAETFSLMIVDEDREVRECLSEMFQSAGYAVTLAENPGEALRALPQSEDAPWPNAIILGQQAPVAPPETFLSTLRSSCPQGPNHVSLIVFPSFAVSWPASTEGPARLVQACRLSTVSNLISVVRGLSDKRAPLPAKSWLEK